MPRKSPASAPQERQFILSRVEWEEIKRAFDEEKIKIVTYMNSNQFEPPVNDMLESTTKQIFHWHEEILSKIPHQNG